MPRSVSRRRLTEADQAAWDSVARLLRPLPGHRVAPAPPQAAPPVTVPRAEPVAPAPTRTPATAPVAVGATPGGLDRGSWNRLRSGKMVPARTLDLHGRTAPRAHAALIAFLQTSYAEQVRCVEIITGRGSGENGGVIRRELPHWLNMPELRPLVLAAVHPHPANPGAVRLLLRRPR